MTTLLSRLPRTLLAAALGLAGIVLVGGSQAGAAEAPVGLGTAGSFAVLAATTVTNKGPSVISGDIGVSPGSAVTGFDPGTGPGTVSNGTIHRNDEVAAQAQADLTTAYNDAAGRSPTAIVSADLAGQTLVSGVYRGTTLGLTGTVTLDAKGDSSAVFIFQAGSTLITGSDSTVALVNGASACNVFWQVGSSATLGTRTAFAGTILADTSVTADTGATVMGRLLARNGAVTLDSNTIDRGNCAFLPATTTTTPAPTTTTTPAATTSTSVPAVTVTTLPTATAGTTGTPSTGGARRAGRRGTSTAAITSSGTGRRTTSAGSGSGDSSVTASRTPLANTGWQLTGAAGAGVLGIILGSAMLAASRSKPASGPHRRFRC